MAGKVQNLLERDGRYFARMVVPEKLRAIVGKSELLEALGGKRADAIRRLPAVVTRFQAELDAARRQADDASPPPNRLLDLSHLARLHYARELEFDERERNVGPSDQEALAATLAARPFIREAYANVLRRVASGLAINDEIEAAIGWALDDYRARGYLSAPSGSPDWRQAARMLAAVQLEALERQTARDAGQLDAEPKHPALRIPAEVAPEKKVPLMELFDGYIAELKASGKGAEAERRWRPIFRGFIAHVGHDDAAKLNKGHFVSWKDKQLKTKSAKSVRDVELASLRAVLQWAVDNDKIDAHPMTGVRMKLPKQNRNREKGYTLEEAKIVLGHALAYQPKQGKTRSTTETAPTAAAKKWCPFLCAYTGARIAEMTQLRKEDVREQDGIHYLRITPEAGSVKTGEYRDVPLHPHLIELGFLDFVKASPAGPLFYVEGGKRGGKAHPSKTVAGRVSEWIKGLGIVPPGVKPNHAWRHRLKTVGREIGVDPRVLDAIQGHAARTAGDDYGDVTLKARAVTIEKFPAYIL